MNLNERIENDFKYHAPNAEKIVDHQHVREAGLLMAQLFVHLLPEGRELSTALTKVEEAVMWANAGIARNNV